MCIKGNGAPDRPEEAARFTADLHIAVTNLDEVNMVCCLTGKRLGPNTPSPGPQF
jgi:trk system potassium uptake protein TrkA